MNGNKEDIDVGALKDEPYPGRPHNFHVPPYSVHPLRHVPSGLLTLQAWQSSQVLLLPRVEPSHLLASVWAIMYDEVIHDGSSWVYRKVGRKKRDQAYIL
jgi:hypothetical protein